MDETILNDRKCHVSIVMVLRPIHDNAFPTSGSDAEIKRLTFTVMMVPATPHAKYGTVVTMFTSCMPAGIMRLAANTIAANSNVAIQL